MALMCRWAKRPFTRPKPISGPIWFSISISKTGASGASALKFDLDNGAPKNEWSYGFRVLESDQETHDGEQVNVLKKLDIFEVSPVVRGAGNETRTVDMKSDQPKLVDKNLNAVAIMP